jgi:hypothetical protein
VVGENKMGGPNSRFYNNGFTTKVFRIDQRIPEGFVPGILYKGNRQTNQVKAIHTRYHVNKKTYNETCVYCKEASKEVIESSDLSIKEKKRQSFLTSTTFSVKNVERRFLDPIFCKELYQILVKNLKAPNQDYIEWAFVHSLSVLGFTREFFDSKLGSGVYISNTPNSVPFLAIDKNLQIAKYSSNDDLAIVMINRKISRLWDNFQHLPNESYDLNKEMNEVLAAD